MRMMDIVLRTFHGMNGIMTSVPASNSSAIAIRLNAAIP
jgi:hypothetical protein